VTPGPFARRKWSRCKVYPHGRKLGRHALPANLHATGYSAREQSFFRHRYRSWLDALGAPIRLQQRKIAPLRLGLSLSSQCTQGINIRGSARWNEAGDYRYHCHATYGQ
jgi:hypothetical protein